MWIIFLSNWGNREYTPAVFVCVSVCVCKCVFQLNDFGRPEFTMGFDANGMTAERELEHETRAWWCRWLLEFLHCSASVNGNGGNKETVKLFIRARMIKGHNRETIRQLKLENTFRVESIEGSILFYSAEPEWNRREDRTFAVVEMRNCKTVSALSFRVSSIFFCSPLRVLKANNERKACIWRKESETNVNLHWKTCTNILLGEWNYLQQFAWIKYVFRIGSKT